MTGKTILVTGAARSGKSEWAERLALQHGGQVVYVATAKIDLTDTEWQARIEQHRQRRPANWQVLESATNLAEIIKNAPPDNVLVVDSLGTWVATYLEEDEATWLTIATQLLTALRHSPSTIILVAEETGWGVVPAYALGRLFRDRLGALTRQVGAIASPVYLVTAGHVLNLSQLGTPLESE
jgi:adenosylcobinamide kinase / adenosylcobinamide-phosphate guanylyltransferase